MTLNGDLATGSETSLVVTSIPANTPQSGTLRVTLDDLRIRRIAYSAHNGTTTFTITDESWLDPNDATGSAPVMCSYIDDAASGTTISYTTIYTSGPQDLYVVVRNGATPIKTYEGAAQLLATGGGATASQISDA